MKNLSILIPVLNQEEVLDENLKRIRKYAKKAEILILYDVTKKEFRQKAFETARMIGRKYKAKTIFRFNKRGFGSMLRIGFREACGDYVLIMMGDLCDDPKTIPRMMKKMEAGYDVVGGSRYMKGGGIIGNTMKQRISSFVSVLISMFSKLKMRDVTNAFKMYRKTVLQTVRADSESFEVSAELTLKAAKQGYRIAEVPTVWKNRSIGTSNFSMLGEAGKYFRMFLFAAFEMPSLLTKFILFAAVLAVIYFAVFML